MLKYLPNLLTLLRIILLFPYVWSLQNGYYVTTLAMFVLAGLSDSLDGWLARHYRCTSQFGALVDPIADKLLLLVSLFMVHQLALIPTWLLGLLVARDMIIVLGALAVFIWFRSKLYFKPIWLSKVNTFLQIGLIFLLLLKLVVTYQAPVWIGGLMYGTALIAIISCLQYMSLWTKRCFFEL